jgi:predicted amidophosphoribosyltransferase
MVTVYKDGGEHRLAPVISALMVECLGQWLQWAESIVPVPPRPGAMSTRGFDHMRAIARHVARETGLPIQTVLVARTVADQRTLGREDRLANTVGRYEMRRDAKVSGRLLVLDDVFTTGATLEACSLALLAAGASEVRGCTVARATDVAVS